MKKIYVDGCSYTYGLNLDREFSLARLINANEDRSRPAKSNIAMTQDLYRALDSDFDVFVIGFTFSSRFLFDYNGAPIDMHPNDSGIHFEGSKTGHTDEQEYKELHKLFYKYSATNVFDSRSDYIVDSTIALLEQQQKQYVIFSWENRNIINKDKIFYPRRLIPRKYNQSPTNWHLTEEGMQELAKIVKGKL
jgi:hypothetical protein